MVHRIALFIASLTAALVLAAGLALNGLAPAADPVRSLPTWRPPPRTPRPRRP